MLEKPSWWDENIGDTINKVIDDWRKPNAAEEQARNAAAHQNMMQGYLRGYFDGREAAMASSSSSLGYEFKSTTRTWYGSEHTRWVMGNNAPPPEQRTPEQNPPQTAAQQQTTSEQSSPQPSPSMPATEQQAESLQAHQAALQNHLQSSNLQAQQQSEVVARAEHDRDREAERGENASEQSQEQRQEAAKEQEREQQHER